MVVGILPLVQKGHPCRELDQHTPHHNHVPAFPVFPLWFQFPVVFSSLHGHYPHYPHHHVPAFTIFHCMGLNSLHGSPPLSCTYIHCMGPFLDLVTFFALRALGCTYMYGLKVVFATFTQHCIQTVTHVERVESTLCIKWPLAPPRREGNFKSLLFCGFNGSPPVSPRRQLY